MSAGQVKRAVSNYAYRLGLTQNLVKLQSIFQPETNNAFRILIYHRVNDFSDPFTIDSVDAVDFENQIRYLSRHYHVLSLADIYEHLANGKNLPKQCVAITFDDGYEDNYTYAYEILKKYELPATIFITAEGVDEQVPLWFDRVLWAFKVTIKRRFVCPLTDEAFNIQTVEKKLTTAHAILERLKKTANAQRKVAVGYILDGLGSCLNDEGIHTSKLLSWRQIREMQQHKISFGSHTMTHPILANLTTDEIEWELSAPRQMIEKEIDSEVFFMAYPNGKKSDIDENVIQAAKKAGYKAAVTTEPDINGPETDLFRWGRYRPWQNQVAHFAMAFFLQGLHGLAR